MHSHMQSSNLIPACSEEREGTGMSWTVCCSESARGLIDSQQDSTAGHEMARQRALRQNRFSAVRLPLQSAGRAELSASGPSVSDALYRSGSRLLEAFLTPHPPLVAFCHIHHNIEPTHLSSTAAAIHRTHIQGRASYRRLEKEVKCRKLEVVSCAPRATANRRR